MVRRVQNKTNGKKKKSQKVSENDNTLHRGECDLNNHECLSRKHGGQNTVVLLLANEISA